MSPMSSIFPERLKPVFCRPHRCKQVCDGDDEANTDELRISELQQLPWAHLTESSSTWQTANNENSACQVPGDALADGVLEERSRIAVAGAYYSGQWCGSVWHGQGRLERAEWGSYEGQFVNGKATGSGHFEKATGDVYDGQWHDDRAHGDGQYRHCDGSTYNGQWDSDLKSGTGSETWPDGSTYDGDFVLGKKHGKGNYRVCDGSTYEGEFRDDMMDGYGQYVFIDGRIYCGQWERSRMMGNGCMTWPDGRRYAGQFKDDKKWGYGKLTWADGRAYEGQWLQGKQHGEGVTIGRKGRRNPGHWHHGKTMSPLTASATLLPCLPSEATTTIDGMAVSPMAEVEGEKLLAAMKDCDHKAMEAYANLFMNERGGGGEPVQTDRSVADRHLGVSNANPEFSYICDIDGNDDVRPPMRAELKADTV